MKRKITGIIAVGLILSLLWGLSATLPVQAKDSAAGLEYAADIISIKGDGFKVKRINSPHWLMGRINMPNYVKDVLETDGNTVSCIEFLNGSQLGINKNTKIEIISTAGARDITQRGFVKKIVLKSGTVWAKITGQNSKGFEMSTSKGVLGVKGTEFIVETQADKDTDKVTVLEGEVDYTRESSPSVYITPGEEIVFSLGEEPVKTKKAVEDIRKALNMQFPGLNPAEQAIVSVFFHHAIGSIPGAGNALSIANQTLSVVEDPESYIKSRAASEISSRTGISVPGGLFGGGGSSKKQEKVYVENLSPDGKTVNTYLPEFQWNKVDGAKAYRVLITLKPIVKGEKNPGYYAFANVKDNKFNYSNSARALKPGLTYYWTVIAMDDKDKAIAIPKNSASFTMGRYEQLGIIGLSPSGEIKAKGEDMVFDWTPVLGVTKYQVIISKNSDLSNAVVTQDADTNYVVIPKGMTTLSKGTPYYWRVTPLEKDMGTPEIAGVVNTFTITEGK